MESTFFRLPIVLPPLPTPSPVGVQCFGPPNDRDGLAQTDGSRRLDIKAVGVRVAARDPACQTAGIDIHVGPVNRFNDLGTLARPTPECH